MSLKTLLKSSAAPLALAVLFYVAFYFRFSTLGQRYLDIDEAFSLYTALQNNWSALFAVIKKMGPIQHGLDFAIDHVVWSMSPQLFTLRVVKALWGVLTVMMTYQLAAHLKDKTTGFVTAFLLAIAPFHIEYSQMVRYYALIGLLSVVTIFCFFKSRGSKKWLAVFSISMVLYQAIYPFALVGGAACLIFVWMYDRKKTLSYVLALIPSWIMLAVWSLTLGRGISSSPFQESSEMIISVQVFKAIFLRFGQDNPFVATLYLIFFLAGIKVYGKTLLERQNRAALLLMGSSIFGALLLILLWVHIAFYPRYLLPLLPVFLFFTAVGLCAIPNGLPRNARLLCLTIALVFFTLAARRALAPPQKMRAYLHDVFISASQTLRDKYKEGDLIIFSNPNMGATFLAYFDFPAFVALLPPELGRGFLLFKFPPASTIATLCTWDTDFATIDPSKLRTWRAAHPHNAIWLVHIPVNYFMQADPFGEGLGIPQKDLLPTALGVYLYSPA